MSNPWTRRNARFGPGGLALCLLVVFGCEPPPPDETLPKPEPPPVVLPPAEEEEAEPEVPSPPMEEPAEVPAPFESPPPDPEPPADAEPPEDLPTPEEPEFDEELLYEPPPPRETDAPYIPPTPPYDLGDPLVENVEALRPLHEENPVWIDVEGQRLVMVGVVCQRRAPLEMFACLVNTKEHEAIVAVPTHAQDVHAGLLVLGAEVGRPVRYYPEYVPASGTEVEVTVAYRDEDGQIHQYRAQEWIRHRETGKPMEYPWVFAGSGFWEDPLTGKIHYQAESGDFICVANFPSAMLDLPVKSSQDNALLLFEPWTERIPEVGSPVTVTLTPLLETRPSAEEAPADSQEPGPPADEPAPPHDVSDDDA